jgi:RNA polymerase sigma-70 factor (ECF subfamily)
LRHGAIAYVAIRDARPELEVSVTEGGPLRHATGNTRCMLYEYDHHQLAGSPSTDETDEMLMGRIRARDESALAAMYRRHTPLLRTVVSRVVHNHHDVDELLQEIFLQLWNRAEHYEEGKGKALGWIITLARRRAIDGLRRRLAYSRAEERLRFDAEAKPVATSQGADIDAQDSDRAVFFQQILTTLPTAQRQAVHLSYFCGLSQREIAAKTGIPLGTIKTRLELALRKVKSAVLTLGRREDWCLAT